MPISDEFRRYAYTNNGNSGGAQNASIRVVFLMFSQVPPTRKVFADTAEYAMFGAHTETTIIARFWTYYNGLNIPPHTRVDLVRVEMFSRKNTCLDCTQALVNFKAQLNNRLGGGPFATFDLVIGGKLHIANANGGQISLQEALFRREAGSTTLRMDRWTVEREGVLYQNNTLGNVNDPIVLI